MENYLREFDAKDENENEYESCTNISQLGPRKLNRADLKLSENESDTNFNTCKVSKLQH